MGHIPCLVVNAKFHALAIPDPVGIRTHLCALPVDREEAGGALEEHAALVGRLVMIATPEVECVRRELQPEDGGEGEVVLLAQLVLAQVLFPSLKV